MQKIPSSWVTITMYNIKDQSGGNKSCINTGECYWGITNKRTLTEYFILKCRKETHPTNKQICMWYLVDVVVEVNPLLLSVVSGGGGGVVPGGGGTVATPVVLDTVTPAGNAL